MVRRTLLAWAALGVTTANAQGFPTPAQQDCNLLTQTVASTAIWRDNGVPITKAQSNVEAVLVQMPATEQDKKQWHDAVTAIYGSQVTADQLSAKLGSLCH